MEKLGRNLKGLVIPDRVHAVPVLDGASGCAVPRRDHVLPHISFCRGVGYFCF